MGTERYSLYFLPGTYGTDEEPLQVQVGYYTEVAGLGASPGDVQINGAIEVYNRCFDDPVEPGVRRLLRAEQLLAQPVEPDDQRQHPRPGRLRGLGEHLGRLAGGLDASGGRQGRQPDAHGLLHGPVLRQRRLHRRLPGR